MSNSKRLRDLLARRAATTVPGAANALFARVIEDLGFEAVYVTGAGVANMHLGVPDIGLTTMTEVRDTVAAIADAVSVPIIVDADTGYGNAVNMVRTVRALERAGAAGIQIEDQVFPKKCGHFAGKHVIEAAEMVQKIKAAVDARHDPSLQIIARTDARAIEGLDRAIERAQTYYRRDDLTGLLPLGALESLAAPGESQKLAFTSGLIEQVYGDRINDAILEQCRYVRGEDQQTWWIPSGRVFYSPGLSDTPADELAFARRHFFTTYRTRDPFGATALTLSDPYALLLSETRDALGNRVVADS